jgi:hypothetical protein
VSGEKGNHGRISRTLCCVAGAVTPDLADALQDTNVRIPQGISSPLCHDPNCNRAA